MNDKAFINLIMLDKIILFCDTLFEEDVNEEYFADKFKYDIEFIHSFFIEYSDEYTRLKDKTEKEQFIKSYFYSIKRFYKLLNKIKKDTAKAERYSMNQNVFNDIFENTKKRIDQIKNQDERFKMIDTEKQLINEEEYELLLQDLISDNQKPKEK